MTTRNRFIALPAAAVALFTAWGSFAGCDAGGGIYLPAPQERAWVAVDPVQCLGNAWERDWLERHGGNYGAYPTDPRAQERIVRDYYAGFGVDVTEMVSVPRYPITCDACSCPRGDSFYLLVRDRDVEMMVALGFRVEGPRPWLPDTTFLGEYGFAGYDTGGRTVMSGRLSFLRRDSTLVTGTWDLGPPAASAPRSGKGVFAGEVVGDTVILNLDPGMADNNLFLVGGMPAGTYEGRWELVGFPGVMRTGTFFAWRLRR